MTRYKACVDIALKLVRERGEVTAGYLAYMLNINPTYAREILKTLPEIDPNIKYFRGAAYYDPEVREDGRTEG